MPSSLADISSTAGLVIFAGMALISLSLLAWIYMRFRGRESAIGNLTALAGISIGLILAGGGYTWLTGAATRAADERAVLVALYATYAPTEGSAGGAMIWHETTNDFHGNLGYARLANDMFELKRETYEDFVAANQTLTPVDADLPIGYPLLLIRPEDAERIRRENAMEGLVEMGWSGVHSHSRPGFSKDHRQALIYQATVCGPLCGLGRAYMFQKGDDGKWRLAGTAELWIS